MVVLKIQSFDRVRSNLGTINTLYNQKNGIRETFVYSFKNRTEVIDGSTHLSHNCDVLSTHLKLIYNFMSFMFHWV